MAGVIETLERLSAGRGVRRRLGAGEMLFATGDPVRSLFVVIEVLAGTSLDHGRPEG